MTSKQHRYYRIGILYGICEFLGVPKDQYKHVSKLIHQAIKKCFEIDSFRNVSVSEFEKIAGTIRMIMAREFGCFLKEADEQDLDINNMSMREFLEHKKIY